MTVELEVTEYVPNERVRLVALFSPEHGLEGKLDVRDIPDGFDRVSQRPVFSLYGKTRKPAADSLRGVDALVFTAESGSAWSLVYPSYSVAVPHPVILEVPLAYPVARGDEGMVELLNTWIALKQRDKTLEHLYQHWVLGAAAAESGPRWSIIRDVLHWVD